MIIYFVFQFKIYVCTGLTCFKQSLNQEKCTQCVCVKKIFKSKRVPIGIKCLSAYQTCHFSQFSLRNITYFQFLFMVVLIDTLNKMIMCQQAEMQVKAKKNYKYINTRPQCSVLPVTIMKHGRKICFENLDSSRKRHEESIISS